MPTNSIDLEHFSIREVRKYRMQEKLLAKQTANMNRRVKFLQKKFPYALCSGYGIGNVHSIYANDKLTWAAVDMVLKNIKPYIKYAGYRVYTFAHLPSVEKKVLQKLVGEWSPSTLFFFVDK